MRVLVLGATGAVGRRVVAEGLSRGHEVTAAVRDPARMAALPSLVRRGLTDVGDADEVAGLSEGKDVVISAVRPPPGSEPELVTMTKAIVAGVARTGARLLVVGGAGSLTVPGTGGSTVVDDAAFPTDLLPIALAGAEQLEVCRAAIDVDWTYLSPPAVLEPGKRTGNYRLGADELVVDSRGNSTISLEDLAVVLLDEAERPMHRRVRFTAAY